LADAAATQNAGEVLHGLRAQGLVGDVVGDVRVHAIGGRELPNRLPAIGRDVLIAQSRADVLSGEMSHGIGGVCLARRIPIHAGRRCLRDACLHVGGNAVDERLGGRVEIALGAVERIPVRAQISEASGAAGVERGLDLVAQVARFCVGVISQAPIATSNQQMLPDRYSDWLSRRIL